MFLQNCSFAETFLVVMKQNSQEGMFMYKREVILVLRMKEIKENIKKATDSWNYILPAIKKGGADSG